jgi:DNA-directed RNA polymerase specialized sigma24 family protein
MDRSTKPFAEMIDADLIRAARHQPAAFEELFERHATVLRQWLFAQTGDAGLANDLVGETFAQAWRSVRRFRGEDERSGAARLYGIARHLVHQHYKRGRVETAARRRRGIASVASDEDDIEEMLGHIDTHPLSPAVREAFTNPTRYEFDADDIYVTSTSQLTASELQQALDDETDHTNANLAALRSDGVQSTGVFATPIGAGCGYAPASSSSTTNTTP